LAQYRVKKFLLIETSLPCDFMLKWVLFLIQ
jgi:hypothetical protein